MKKPGIGRAHFSVAVFSPADSDGAVIQALDACAVHFLNIPEDLLPRLRALVLSSGYDYSLYLLGGRRRNQPLYSSADKLVAGSGFRCLG